MEPPAPPAPAPAAPRRSRVDEAEAALRAWLSPGRFRPEDRLPPEHDLSAMLGVSRGTLRAALARLEEAGAIRRRRGSGTFVAPSAVPPPGLGDAGLEVLQSWSSLAARAGLTLGCTDVRIRTRRPPKPARAALGGSGDAETTVVDRTLTVDGAPAGWMRDVLAPGTPLPPDDEVAARLAGGAMLLDVLRADGVTVAYARAEVRPRLVEPDDRVARALGLTVPTAALELAETMHGADGLPVQWSLNVLPPGPLRIHVLRALPHAPPPALGPPGG